MKKVVLNPVGRSNNFCSVEVSVENKRVVDARCIANFFRGFEIILRGRDPRDASYLTERICGICSSAHGTAASFALEDAAGVRPPRNGTLLRNLIFGADILQNHIRHFYMFDLPDYVQGPKLRPFIPGYTKGYRFSKETNESMMRHYFQSLAASRQAHELVTLLGGKAPFPHGLLAGGSTVPPTANIVMDFSFKLKKINDFINSTMLPDVFKLAEVYQQCYIIGNRPANFLEFGLFPQHDNDERCFSGGVVIDGRFQKLNSIQIKEHVSYSWYKNGNEPEHPALGNTEPDREKNNAYSWVKAPRYGTEALEGGPLARLWISGDYRRGVSVMDRIVARALEAKKIGLLMENWLEELQPGEPVFTPFEVPREAEGAGLTGAMRGPLGHWLKIEKGRIAHYEIITPTAWNFSPRDDAGRLGPVEEALIGTPLEDVNETIEVSRVIHSFDVCSSCSAHVMVVGSPVKEFLIAP